MLALFLAIALLGTDGAYGRSTIDHTGDNHDNTDLGGSELHAKAGAYYGGDDAIDFAGAKVDNIDLSGSPVTVNSIIGLGPSRPSLLAPPASPSPPSPSPPSRPGMNINHYYSTTRATSSENQHPHLARMPPIICAPAPRLDA